jgi:glycosyltransferase involved in cell wall biosynthesis
LSENRRIRVWHVGPHQDAKGGISTVIRLLMAEQSKCSGLCVSHLVTSVTGAWPAKATVVVLALLRLLFTGSLRRVDLLHVHISAARSMVRKAMFMRLARALRIPYVVHVHGSNFDNWYLESTHKQQAWIRRQLDAADVIVALSTSWKSFLVTLTTTPVHVVYNSVPLDAYPWPRPMRRPGPLRMLFLGLLGERKGIYDLLEAAHRATSGTEAVPLELRIGGDGAILETKEMISRLDLQDHVEYLGWVEAAQKAELLADADIFALPSYHEGLPMAILEAMSAGAAILSTPVNGIPEAVQDGFNGVLVDPGDVRGLAAAIRMLSADPARVRRLGAAGRGEVCKRFNIQVAAGTLKEVYGVCTGPK